MDLSCRSGAAASEALKDGKDGLPIASFFGGGEPSSHNIGPRDGFTASVPLERFNFKTVPVVRAKRAQESAINHLSMLTELLTELLRLRVPPAAAKEEWCTELADGE